MISDKQNILGLCQQWTNETNTNISILGWNFPPHLQIATGKFQHLDNILQTKHVCLVSLPDQRQ